MIDWCQDCLEGKRYTLSTAWEDSPPPFASAPRYACPRCDWAGSNDHSVWMAHQCAKQAPLTGGKLAGNHYYRVEVAEPISPEVKPYTAECADIIEALGMTFNEGEAFKALWRLAAGRQGRGKAGTAPQYDADKVAHYGARVAAQTKRAAP